MSAQKMLAIRPKTREFWSKLDPLLKNAKRLRVEPNLLYALLTDFVNKGIPEGSTFFEVKASDLPSLTEFSDEWRQVADYLKVTESEASDAWTAISEISNIADWALNQITFQVFVGEHHEILFPRASLLPMF